MGSISGQSYQRREFSASDIELLEFVAAQVGPALGTMRTLAEAQSQAAEAYALAGLMRRGTELADRDEVYELVCTTAVRLLGADLAGLILGDRQRRGLIWRGVTGNLTDAWKDERYRRTHPNGMRIFSGETLLHGVDDGPFDPEHYPFFAKEQIRVGMALPLDPANGAHGALCLGWRFAAHLAPGRLELAEALAAFSGTLVASATSRLERDALVAGAPVVLMAVLPDGMVTLCEGAAAAALGFGQELVGRRLAELLPNETALLAAFEQAVAGIVPEPLEIEVLGHALDVAIQLREGGIFLVGTDVTERWHAERELRRRAVEDDLTGLPNDHEVIRRIAAALPDGPVSAVVADIRSFDHVNEAIGYSAADQLLRALGERLVRDVPDAIVVGRIGGDEFAVAAYGDDPQPLALRTRASLEAFIGSADDSMAVDVRCGLASIEAGGDASTLLRHADSALQVARRGNNPMVVWDSEEAARRRPQHAVAQQLRRALDDCTFTVVYQPIVEADTLRIRRAEALARWPAGGDEPVSPDVFVPLAERLGRVGQLTAHVLATAVREVLVPYGLPVSVNISPLDVMHGDLPGLVNKQLKLHELDPSLLVLELTEHAALEAGDAGLVELAAMGVTLSIDDFGRGWSSLETLKRVPARELKLDRSYVSSASEHETDEAIVRAAVTVGHALGMQVVAEGVEDTVVLDAVRTFGADLAQGFHIARPMPAAALAAWLKSNR